MKTRIQIALAGSFISILAHTYLTFHYYSLKYGYSTGQSICNINAKFNCDAVAASDYAAFMGVPLSLWGLASNLILFGLILLGWLEWSKNPERVRRFALGLSGLSVLGSIVMGSISLLYLHSYCLVCIGLYVLSAIVFVSYRQIPAKPLVGLGHDFSSDLGDALPLVGSLVAIPVMAFLLHAMFNNYAIEQTGQNGGPEQVTQMVNASMAAWATAPKQDFVAKPSLAMGPSTESAALTLIEFADFRCGHCKHASLTLDAFAKSHPDVRFEFYAFPLDGACNPEIKQANQISCRLAEAVYCAEHDSGKGWEMHHAIYAAQDEINQLGDPAAVDLVLNKTSGELGLNWSTVQHCVDDGATIDAIRAQAKQGNLVSVKGTPTIFANGRMLEGGQLMPVLEEAYKTSRAK